MDTKGMKNDLEGVDGNEEIDQNGDEESGSVPEDCLDSIQDGEGNCTEGASHSTMEQTQGENVIEEEQNDIVVDSGVVDSIEREQNSGVVDSIEREQNSGVMDSIEKENSSQKDDLGEITELELEFNMKGISHYVFSTDDPFFLVGLDIRSNLSHSSLDSTRSILHAFKIPPSVKYMEIRVLSMMADSDPENYDNHNIFEKIEINRPNFQDFIVEKKSSGRFIYIKAFADNSSTISDETESVETPLFLRFIAEKDLEDLSLEELMKLHRTQADEIRYKNQIIEKLKLKLEGLDHEIASSNRDMTKASEELDRLNVQRILEVDDRQSELDMIDCNILQLKAEINALKEEKKDHCCVIL